MMGHRTISWDNKEDMVGRGHKKNAMPLSEKIHFRDNLVVNPCNTAGNRVLKDSFMAYLRSIFTILQAGYLINVSAGKEPTKGTVKPGLGTDLVS